MYSSYSPYSYTTVYEYEATSIEGDISLKLSPSYAITAFLLMLLTAFLAFAFVLFTAIANKKARPFGIVTAVFQPIGVYAAYKSVLTYAAVDFSALEMTVKSKTSMQDAMSKLYEKLGEAFMSNVLPQMVQYIFWLSVLAMVTIITLVYIIMLLKGQGKGLTIAALILLIVRHFCISSVDVFGLLLQWETQSMWDLVFRFFYLLPLFLLAIQGLIALVGNRKKKTLVVEEPANNE